LRSSILSNPEQNFFFGCPSLGKKVSFPLCCLSDGIDIVLAQQNPFMNALIPSFVAFIRKMRPTSQRGQTLVEYALIMAIITVIAIGVFSQLGQRVVVIFSAINRLLDTAQASH